VGHPCLPAAPQGGLKVASEAVDEATLTQVLLAVLNHPDPDEPLKLLSPAYLLAVSATAAGGW
jgi:hypothetical protein